MKACKSRFRSVARGSGFGLTWPIEGPVSWGRKRSAKKRSEKGRVSGRWRAEACCGRVARKYRVGANLRETEYAQVQRLSYQNLDRFETSSLVTRLALFTLAFDALLVLFVRFSSKRSSRYYKAQ